jgi:hypothetical protein
LGLREEASRVAMKVECKFDGPGKTPNFTLRR